MGYSVWLFCGLTPKPPPPPGTEASLNLSVSNWLKVEVTSPWSSTRGGGHTAPVLRNKPDTHIVQILLLECFVFFFFLILLLEGFVFFFKFCFAVLNLSGARV